MSESNPFLEKTLKYWKPRRTVKMPPILIAGLTLVRDVYGKIYSGNVMVPESAKFKIDPPMYSVKLYGSKLDNEYDIKLPAKYEDCPWDERLGEFLYEMVFLNPDPGFNIEACLDYHYEKYKGDKKRFIDFTRTILIAKPYNKLKSQQLTDSIVGLIFGCVFKCMMFCCYVQRWQFS